MNIDYSEAKKIINQQKPDFLEKDNSGKGYVCPFCGNGTGKTGVGIGFEPYKIDEHGNPKYHCFSANCNGGGDYDVLNLLAKKLLNLDDTKGENFIKAIEEGIKYYQIADIDIEKNSNIKKNVETKQEKTNLLSKEEDEELTKRYNEYRASVKNYISICEGNNDFQYLRSRGISEKIQRAFHIGLDKKNNRCVIPYTEDFCNKRELDKNIKDKYNKTSTTIRYTEQEIKIDEKKRYKSKSFEAPIFNIKALESYEPCFITEGEIDALSLIELGFNALALGGKGNRRKIINKIKELGIEMPIIYFADNDHAGLQAAESIEKEFKAENLDIIIFSLKEDENFSEVKDVNEALIKDRVALRKICENLVNKVKIKYGQRATDILPFFRNIENEYFSEYKTGFKCFDDDYKNFCGGIHEGLYIIGAVSSFGKTTFCLQLAEEIAFRGKDVIFFSLEQSRKELVSKGLSRRTYLFNRVEKNAKLRKTNIKILNSNLWKLYTPEEKKAIYTAIDSYEKEEKNLHIYEGKYNNQRITVKTIKEIVLNHIKKTGNKPAVFIDYLQIIAPTEEHKRDTDKQIVDDCVYELKDLSRLFNIPIIAISSFNRDSYLQPVSLTSFKESGAIEYSSDILIGLQPYGWDIDIPLSDKERINYIRTINKEVKLRKKNHEAIPIEVMILKNRGGEWFTGYFEYIHAYNSFTEIEESDLKRLAFEETKNKLLKKEENNKKEEQPKKSNKLNLII